MFGTEVRKPREKAAGWKRKRLGLEGHARLRLAQKAR